MSLLFVWDMGSRRITQRNFVAAVREMAAVSYHPPGTFSTAGQKITIPEKTLSRFLLRLSAALSFEEYDRLTRAVWVAKLRAAPDYPASPCKLGLNPDNLKR